MDWNTNAYKNREIESIYIGTGQYSDQRSYRRYYRERSQKGKFGHRAASPERKNTEKHHF